MLCPCGHFHQFLAKTGVSFHDFRFSWIINEFPGNSAFWAIFFLCIIGRRYSRDPGDHESRGFQKFQSNPLDAQSCGWLKYINLVSIESKGYCSIFFNEAEFLLPQILKRNLSHACHRKALTLFPIYCRITQNWPGPDARSFGTFNII